MIKIGYSNTTTGATDQSSVIRGNVALVSGRWTGSTGTAFINTGGSAVLGMGVSIDTVTDGSTWFAGTSVYAAPSANMGSAGVEQGVIAVRVSGDVKGDWYALVKQR